MKPPGVALSRVGSNFRFPRFFKLGNTEDGPTAKLVSTALDLDDSVTSQIADVAPGLLGQLFDIAAFTKPMSGTMIIGGVPVHKDFYSESEWRFVPSEYELVTSERFDKDRDVLNELASRDPLRFSPQDVRYVFVESEVDIPHVFDFIQANMGHVPLTDAKIMCSRIVDIKALASDV